jgi:hypothetical protein
MRIIIVLLFFQFYTGCDFADTSNQAKHPASTDTPALNRPLKLPQPDISVKPDGAPVTARKIDTALLIKLSEKILRYIKAKNYKSLSPFIHPQHGIRFSPYAFIDIAKDRVLSGDQLLKLAKENKTIDWHSSWEKEAKLLTVDQYFRRFVYDADFLNAELKSLNEYHSQGTDLNNIDEIYPGCNVVEFFFSGFDAKYAGLDFRALRLVYEAKNNIPYLRGIVHDEWTP